MSKNGLTPPLGAALARACTRAGSAVTRLRLERNALGWEGCCRLCAVLEESGSSGRGGTRLLDLDLSHNAIGGLGASKAIAGLLSRGQLTRLVLTSNPIGKAEAAAEGAEAAALAAALEGVKLLAAAIAVTKSLRELQLRDAGLEASAGEPLGAALAENRSLETLSLWKNRLGKAGGAAFVNAMKVSARTDYRLPRRSVPALLSDCDEG